MEKAKERAKGKAEEKAMVEDPAQTDAWGRLRRLLRTC